MSWAQRSKPALLNRLPAQQGTEHPFQDPLAQAEIAPAEPVFLQRLPDLLVDARHGEEDGRLTRGSARGRS